MTHCIDNLPANTRFLLGFSGGVDSSALFFLLLESGVSFDLAMVDYGVRAESKQEVAYARELAERYGKTLHLLHSERIDSDFEARARQVRYGFFARLVEEGGYGGIILAHQLNDRIEWLLMQLCKGVGLNTLLGFGFCEKVLGVDVFRPLLEVSKSEIYCYCRERGIAFFEDVSNEDGRFLRNRYRKLVAFLGEQSSGVRTSLKLLEAEREELYPRARVEVLGGVRGFGRRGVRADLHQLDLECKKLGLVLSRGQREEILRCGFCCEVADLVIACNAKKIFVASKRGDGVGRVVAGSQGDQEDQRQASGMRVRASERDESGLASQGARMSRSYRDEARRMGLPHRLRPLFFPLWQSGEIKWEDLKRFLTKI